MSKFTVVYFETTRIERTVDAESVEEAIYRSEELRSVGSWDGCDEESLGTDGVEEVLDERGERVYTAAGVDTGSGR